MIVVTPAAFSRVMNVTAWSTESCGARSGSAPVGYDTELAIFPPYLPNSFVNSAKSMPLSPPGYATPKTRGFAFRSPPAHFALRETSALPAHSAAFVTRGLLRTRGGTTPQHGTPITTGTLSRSADSNTIPPPLRYTAAKSITANGFIDATLTASARCVDSSMPVDSTNAYSTARPHVSYVDLNIASVSIVESGSVPGLPVDWSMMFPACAVCCARSAHRTTTLIESFFTPCAVAPPLSSPSFHGLTHGAAV